MFEPNSIKSLLSKRKSNRIQSQKQEQNTKDASSIQSSLDIDYSSIVQIKMMTKDIQNKIQSIRQWRQHQKQMMQEKIKLNSELVDGISQAHMKNLETEAERQELQLQKILDKLKQKTLQIKVKQNQQLYDSQRIFQVLTQTENLRQQLKQKNQQTPVDSGTNYKQLVNQIDEINHIFKKQEHGEQNKNNDTKKVDSKLLQKQMDQIQSQLKEIQQLLADDQSKPKGSKNNKGK